MAVGYIPKQGLVALKSYKYSGSDKSIIAKYIGQPFWEWVVTFVPLTMAPNMVTFIGFLFIIASYLLTIIWGSNLEGYIPGWVLVINALFLFIYQTMDAIDGKQARRTQASSPLGELVDHGCDALSTTLLCLNLMSALQVSGWWAMYSLTFMMLSFYAAQWQEFYTGALDLGYVNVTEAQIGTMATHLFTAFVGTQWWTNSFLGLQYSHIFVLLATAPTMYMAGDVFAQMYKYLPQQKIEYPAAAKTFLPFVTVTLAFTLWAVCSPGDIIHTHPHLFFVAFGTMQANMISRLVLCRVTSLSFAPFQPLPVPVYVVAVLCMLGVLGAGTESAALWGAWALSIGGYLYFAYGTVVDICEYLDIGFLFLKEKKKTAPPAN
eukprot:TRINITY_DN1270_c1_g1_i1.p1 TRINITY_DN1270_c1_g1~~TRINITY_DN1270_c1_g1_i1.p1  ORF type:complete len:414 (-),score=66.90 TRINITY_DN1270_c1_g1_i1:52-1182(-)